MVNQLVVPHALTGLDIQRYEARAEEIVPGSETTPEIGGGAVGRDVDDSQLRVSRERRPGRDVAGPLPGVVLPGIVPKLPGPGEHVELPLERPGPSIKRQNIPGHHLLPRLVVSLLG